MLTLVTLPAAFGLRNPSPFCLKVEMAMAWLGLDFSLETEQDPRKAPKGKLPYLLIDGEPLADSELIFDRLNDISSGKLYAGLNAEEKAIGTAFCRLIDDHLYWLMVSSRWLEDDWSQNVERDFFGFVPRLFRGFAFGSAQKQVRQTLHLQGLGRHTLEEQKSFAKRDLQAIADIVSKQHYIVGGRLTAYDFTVAGFLSGLMDNQPATWVSAIANGYPSLREYLERVETGVGVSGRL